MLLMLLLILLFLVVVVDDVLDYYYYYDDDVCLLVFSLVVVAWIFIILVVDVGGGAAATVVVFVVVFAGVVVIVASDDSTNTSADIDAKSVLVCFWLLAWNPVDCCQDRCCFYAGPPCCPRLCSRLSFDNLGLEERATAPKVQGSKSTGGKMTHRMMILGDTACKHHFLYCLRISLTLLKQEKTLLKRF